MVTAADPKELIHVVLYGLSGKITVDGKPFEGQMPAWKGNLKDKELADVITYIRSAWGNTAAPVAVSDLAKVTK